MSTFKRISSIVMIVAILGSSGCFFKRGLWYGAYSSEGASGAVHRGF
jgi:hypothetical protein